MISSVPLSVLLTVIFAATGGYSLLRWASLRAGVAGHHGDRVAELSHLVMSVAMIAMVWAYGGPAGNVAQIVLFTVLAGYFLARLPVGRRGARLGGCPAPGFHLLMCASMVWMVAAMPLLMGGMPTGSAGGHMHGMPMGGADSAGQDGQPPAPTPAWAVVVTVAVSVALLAAAGYWLRRAVRTPARPEVPVGAEVQVDAEVPALIGGGEVRPAEPPARSARRAPSRVPAALTPRRDAVCHLAMSVGMAAMCLAML
ncbi:MAG TPA: DUF5134 domain-containing protein [Pseudonocardia sp.]|uniref:DUF5134 domain-containing protein n=1 Tax=Pseudonocardia sp. TaxID=60912 RepID=UPI002C3B8655|nr:DUF5134 domain-containing protein [Pseudonocardia sp.]HTF49646.1 DUF5134 domain-containing protein [Pseudonocardia sp.]